jgi:hypothetical protein
MGPQCAAEARTQPTEAFTAACYVISAAVLLGFGLVAVYIALRRQQGDATVRPQYSSSLIEHRE